MIIDLATWKNTGGLSSLSASLLPEDAPQNIHYLWHTIQSDKIRFS